MGENIVTYSSVNAAERRRWVAYIDLGRDYLGIRFEGASEEEVRSKASEFWAKDQEKRDQTKANREAARQARAAKSAQEA